MSSKKEVLLKLVVPAGTEKKRETSTHIAVDVFYAKGGTNWVTGGENPRGICAGAVLVGITETSRLQEIFGGANFGKLIEPAKRLNAKRVDVVADEVLAALARKEGPGWELVQKVLAKTGYVLEEASPEAVAS